MQLGLSFLLDYGGKTDRQTHKEATFFFFPPPSSYLLLPKEERDLLSNPPPEKEFVPDFGPNLRLEAGLTLGGFCLGVSSINRGSSGKESGSIKYRIVFPLTVI